MLIDSSRITSADRQVWEQRSRYLLRPPSVTRRVAAAESAIRDFLHEGPAAVSVSWGKDSVVVAHLASLIDPTVRIARVHVAGLDPPESDTVRDAFLASHPHVDYIEHTVTLPVMRGEPGFPGADTDLLGATLAGRTITGVRAAESRQRVLSAAVHGVSTARTCRPILQWTTREVYAYMIAEGLPIHPAYAMSHGGVLTLDDLRVHTLGTAVLHGSSFWPRIVQWEDEYYGDILGEELSRRASL